jgi:hypothetical protein
VVALTGGNWGRTDGGVIPVLPSAMVLLAHVFDLRTRQLQRLSGKQQKVSPVRLTQQKEIYKCLSEEPEAALSSKHAKYLSQRSQRLPSMQKHRRPSHENRERLKAERLAREAATAEGNLKRKPAS